MASIRHKNWTAHIYFPFINKSQLWFYFQSTIFIPNLNGKSGQPTTTLLWALYSVNVLVKHPQLGWKLRLSFMYLSCTLCIDLASLKYNSAAYWNADNECNVGKKSFSFPQCKVFTNEQLGERKMVSALGLRTLSQFRNMFLKVQIVFKLQLFRMETIVWILCIV